MITFDNWHLASDGAVLAMQFDNKSRLLEVLGDLPQDWTWTMLVAVGQALDVISMDVVPGGLEAVLTAETLSLSGYYSMQLKGVRGDVVRHTNVIRVPVQNSLSGDAQWPTIPTEFTEIEQNILDLNQHPPYPGDSGYWMTWDLASGVYVQSQLPLPPIAEGPPGRAATIKVGATTTGEPGTEAAVENVGDENAAILNFTIPAGAAGPTGATPAISVQVSGLPAGSEPTVSVSGTPESPVISLGIPAGQQGAPGANGSDGTDGETPNISIGTVDTLPAGSSATASITGQTPNLELNLGIPQGQQGAPYTLTDEDKQTIVQAVIAALPVYNGEVE